MRTFEFKAFDGYVVYSKDSKYFKFRTIKELRPNGIKSVKL